MSCQASLSGGFSRQDWSVLANTGCHILLEHYISCYPSHQLPWVHGDVWSPETQVAAPPSLLALTGASPNLPGQPQERTPVDNPHAKVEIKPRLKPRGSVAKEEDQNLPTSCAGFRLSPHDHLGRLCVWIYKRSLRAPTKENTSSDSCGPGRQEHMGVGPDYNLSCSHGRARDQRNVGEHPGEMRWTVIPSEGKDADSSESRKKLLSLCFDLFCRFCWFFFFLCVCPLFFPFVIVVNFTGIMKSN